MTFIYSFVARDSVLLADYTAFSGNFTTIAIQCLEKCPKNNAKLTFTCDRHTFNFLISDGFTFLVVADAEAGRQVPYGFLERIKEEFMKNWADRGRTATAHSLEKTFGPRLRYWMEYCQEHPDDFSKLVSVQKKVDEVKNVMVENIERVLERGEKLEVLVDKTEGLRNQADIFQKTGTQIRNRMWWQNVKMKFAVIIVALVVLGIIALVIYLAVRK